jgi:hypothetical protein
LSSKPSTDQVLVEIQRICVTQARELINSGYDHQALTSLVLGMEWFGSILDGKPTGAKNQSRKRFELTLAKLPARYLEVHQKVNLYKQLRNRAIHNPWIENKWLAFTEDNSVHLELKSETVQFSMHKLVDDLNQVINQYTDKS